MMDYLIRLVRDAYPCSCDEAYKVRGLTSPDCFHCVPLAEAAAELEDALDGETAFLLEYVNAEGNCIGFYAPSTPAGTNNPRTALRLSRREDAEALRLSLLDGHLMRSVEHVFSRGGGGEVKRGKGRDMAAEYAAVREILKPYAERAEAAEADRDEWRETAQSEMAGRRAAEAAHKEAAAQWQDEARLRRAAEAEAKRLRLDLTEACRGGAVLARERNEAEALTQRFAKLLERCEDVVLGYDQLHGGGGTSPLAQEICAALRGGGK